MADYQGKLWKTRVKGAKRFEGASRSGIYKE